MLNPTTSEIRDFFRARLRRRGQASLTLAAIAVASALPFMARGATRAGDLDPGFGPNANGKMTIEFAPDSPADPAEKHQIAYSMARLPDQSLVVGGVSLFPSRFSGADSDLALARITSDGNLDPNFGAGGKVALSIGYQESLRALALRPDGKIVAIGGGIPNDSTHKCCADLLFYRFTKEGLPDTTFGDVPGAKVGGSRVSSSGPPGGRAGYTAIGSYPDRVFGLGRSLVIQKDAKIVGVGTFGAPNRSVAIRLDEDGGIDKTFGNAGLAEIKVPDTSATNDFATPKAVLAQTDGKLLVVSSSFGDFNCQGPCRSYVSRLNANGATDTSFGEGGHIEIQPGGGFIARAAAIQPDGKIVAAGDSAGKFMVVRQSPEGLPDYSFGQGGATITEIDGPGPKYSARSLDLQPDGKIVAAGGLPVGAGGAPPSEQSDFALARYNPDGSLDSGFGLSGVRTVDMGGQDIANAISTGLDGKVTVAGTDGKHFALARFASPSADLSLSNTVSSASAVVGDEIKYTIRVDNHGPSPSEDIVLADNLPPGAVYKSSVATSGSCSESSGKITCQISKIDSSQAAVVAVTAQATAAGSLSNTATVDSFTPDPNMVNNSAQAITNVGLALPSVDSITPDCGPPSGGTQVKIIGKLFSGVAEVKFGSHLAASAEIIAASDRELTVRTPPFTRGQAPVTVTTGRGESAPSSRAVFTYSCPGILVGHTPGSSPAGEASSPSTDTLTSAPPVGGGSVGAPSGQGLSSTAAQSPTVSNAGFSQPVVGNAHSGALSAPAQPSSVYSAGNSPAYQPNTVSVPRLAGAFGVQPSVEEAPNPQYSMVSVSGRHTMYLSFVFGTVPVAGCLLVASRYRRLDLRRSAQRPNPAFATT